MLLNSLNHQFSPSSERKTQIMPYFVDYKGFGLGFWINKLKEKEQHS